MFVTGATPGGTKLRLSTTECTYLPTFFCSLANPMWMWPPNAPC